MSSTETDYLHIVTQDRISPRRRDLGRVMIWGSAAILFVLIVIQSLTSLALWTLALRHGDQLSMPTFFGQRVFAGLK